jgi:hypothetical protein
MTLQGFLIPELYPTYPRLAGGGGDFGSPETEIRRAKAPIPRPVSGHKKVFPGRFSLCLTETSSKF